MPGNLFLVLVLSSSFGFKTINRVSLLLIGPTFDDLLPGHYNAANTCLSLSLPSYSSSSFWNNWGPAANAGKCVCATTTSNSVYAQQLGRPIT